MSAQPKLTLHGYFRSGTSYRTRIALNLKGLEYDQVGVDLRKGAQMAANYLDLSPQGLVPALEVAGGPTLFQSPAIIEWLEESFPSPPLLPADRDERATVRAMAAIIGNDIHPLNNLRILKYFRGKYDWPHEDIDAWAQEWIAAGFTALEATIARHGGRHGFGDAIGLVECYLVPQVYSAQRFNADLSPYERLMAAHEAAIAHPAVAAAHPDRQPDAG